MASHFDFLSSEYLPQRYPPSFSQRQRWDHGIPHVLSSAGTSSGAYRDEMDDLEISQISQLTDDDFTPISELPTAFYKFQKTRTPELCAPDPDLYLTPDKAHIPRSNLKSDMEAKDKTGLKVRFDIESSSESEFEKSPEKGSVTVLDQNLSTELPGGIVVEKHVCSNVDNSKPINNGDILTHFSHSKVYPYSVQQKADHVKLKQTQLNKIDTVLKNKKTGNVKTGLHRPKGSNAGVEDVETESVITKEQEERPPVLEYNFPFTEDHETVHESGLLLSSVFERPEYNSSLRLGRELKQLSLSKPDVAKALRETLEKSDTLRTDINEKAACKVNTNGLVFHGLPSLDVPVNDIITLVERSHMSKVKPSSSKNKQHSKPKDPSIKEPDLMELFTDDLQKEEVDLSVTGIVFPKEQLSTASNDKAFDLYRHNLAWDQFG